MSCRYLPYTLTLRSPAVVSTLSGDPNSAWTQPFIPGSAIRGAVAGRLLATGVPGESEKFRDLVLSGQVRYLHAYVEGRGTRTMPMSVAWRVAKDEPQKAEESVAYDLTEYRGTPKGKNVEADVAEWPEEALVVPGAQFVTDSPNGGQRWMGTPGIGARLHQQRDRIQGRPWKEVKPGREKRHGTVYSYEYLQGGEVFRGVIQLMPESQDLAEFFRDLLKEPILVGRARRAGYGGEAVIRFCDRVDSHEYPWARGKVKDNVSPKSLFRLMLTSAYVGRHPKTGQLDPGALENEVHGLFGGRVTTVRHRWAFEAIGGFNKKWRLEVPQAMAVTGGSVLVLRANREIKLKDLREVEHQGIGERRTEGFGRVVFLKHEEKHSSIRLKLWDKPDSAAKEFASVSADDAAMRQLDFVEGRIVLDAARAELDRLVPRVISKAGSSVDGGKAAGEEEGGGRLPDRLRLLLRRVHDEASARVALSKLSRWCHGDRADVQVAKAKDESNGYRRTEQTTQERRRAAVRRKLENVKLAKWNLRQWLEKLLATNEDSSDSKADWDQLCKEVRLVSLPQRYSLRCESAARDLLNSNTALLTVYLIDAVLAALSRQRRGAHDDQPDG